MLTYRRPKGSLSQTPNCYCSGLAKPSFRHKVFTACVNAKNKREIRYKLHEQSFRKLCSILEKRQIAFPQDELPTFTACARPPLLYGSHKVADLVNSTRVSSLLYNSMMVS